LAAFRRSELGRAIRAGDEQVLRQFRPEERQALRQLLGA